MDDNAEVKKISPADAKKQFSSNWDIYSLIPGVCLDQKVKKKVISNRNLGHFFSKKLHKLNKSIVEKSVCEGNFSFLIPLTHVFA